jgi:acyl transferase domain-containing protein
MNLDFKEFIFDPANQETLENTRFTQPALFAVEVSIGRMLIDWGIEPAFMLGHSVGEFVAAHLAGVFSLEDALRMIAARGRLMAALPQGRMLSARGEISTVVAAAGEPVDIASINGPVHCVLSGDNEQIERVRARLEAAGIPCRPLHTSHAFHSVMMDPVVEPFLKLLSNFKLNAPTRTIISTATGQPMTEAQATDPMYWARHLRSTVMFSPAVLRAIDLGANVFLEVGPRTTLSSLAVQHFAKASKAAGECVAISMLADKPDAESEIGGIGIALAKLWCAGVEIPWQKIWEGGRRVPLVSLYPFERKDYRFSEGRKPAHRMVVQAQEPVESHFADEAFTDSAPVAASLDERIAAELGATFKDFSGLTVGPTEATFVESGFDSLVLMQIGVELGKRYGVSVSLRELMESQNTIARLASHIVAKASPDRLSHLTAAPPPTKTVKPDASVSAALSNLQTFIRVSTEPSANLSPSEAGAYLHDKLSAIRDYIDRQLGQIDAPAAVFSDSPQFAVPEPAVAAVPANVEAHIKSGRPLIRRKLERPPMPGAFRSSSGNGEEAWFIYDGSQRRYSRVRQ